MPDRVSKWLDQLRLSQYAELFAAAEIDWDLLSELDAESLNAIGVRTVGHQLRIIKAAKSLEKSVEPDVADDNAVPRSSIGLTANEMSAERRQLTVMFCDLVGSTDLSGQLDPEDLREVVRAYQKTAEEVIQRYEGYIAQYLGDGLLVYFGYPVAHEDDAQRAVHAGIGIPEAIAELNKLLRAQFSVALSVRIGIHTGPVVIGEMGGNIRHENLAMGETPNLAARLQELAEHDTVVISNNTRRLLGELFVLKSREAQLLKGIAEPMISHTVLTERVAETRFAAGLTDGMSAMVGAPARAGATGRSVAPGRGRRRADGCAQRRGWYR